MVLKEEKPGQENLKKEVVCVCVFGEPDVVKISIIPEFRRLRQEDCDFKTNLRYIERPC